MSYYGYARVSTKTQKLQRQIDNIENSGYVCSKIFTDKYTGTKLERPGFTKLLGTIKSGDTIVFDSVSRMSRDATEGFSLYEKLYREGIDLVFLNEPMVNTTVFREKAEQRIQIAINSGKDYTDKFFSGMVELINELLMDIAKEQIQIAFDQAEKEVLDLHKRTADGMKASGATSVKDEDGTVLIQGKISAAKTGTKYSVKKESTAKDIIRKHSKDFNGSLSDKECMTLAGCSRNTFYKYKAELREETMA